MVDATGGTERVALEIARVQARRGESVTVASMGEVEWSGDWEGVTLRHLKPFSWAKVRVGHHVKDMRQHLRLATYIHLRRFNIVHLHEYRATRFFERQPKVMHFHNEPLGYINGQSFDEAARRYWGELGKSGAQIAVSEFVARRLHLSHEHAGPTLPAHIVVDQSGVNTEGLTVERLQDDRQRTRVKLGLKDNDVLFMFAGAVRPEKGVVQLAQAFAKLADEHPNAHLAIAGGSRLWGDSHGALDDTEAKVRSLLTPALSRGQATLLGIVAPTELPSYYAAADIFVLPSMFQETFGLVILEAFAAGIPVIGSRSGGIPELVKEGQTGLIVEQGDVEQLAGAMARMLLDKDLRERMGAAGRKLALSMSWDKTVDRLETIYRDVLGSHRVVL